MAGLRKNRKHAGNDAGEAGFHHRTELLALGMGGMGGF
jgi:hypothetical protein